MSKEARLPRPRTLRRNFGSAAIGNAVFATTQFGILIALAQLTSPTEVGRYTLALAIAAPVMFLFDVGLRQVQVTDAARANEPGEFVGLRIVTDTVAVMLLVLIAAISSFPERTAWTLVAVAAYKGGESLNDIYYGAMQRREQMQLVARARVVRGVTGLIVVAGTLTATRRVEIAVGIAAASNLLLASLSAHRVRQLGVSTRPVFRAQQLRQLLGVAWPLGVSSLLGSLLANVPRYFVQHFDGMAALGIYAAITYLLVVTLMVTGAMAESLSPRMANLYAAGDRAKFLYILQRATLLGLLIGVVGVFGAMLLGRVALDVAFGSEYAGGSTVLVILMAACGVQSATVFFGTAAQALRLFRVQLYLNTASLVVLIVACLLLVPSHGLQGAAWSVLITQVCSAVCLGLITARLVLPRLTKSTRSQESPSPP